MEADRDAPREELVLIEAYYAGELSEEQADDLRRRLSADPDLLALAAGHERILRYGLHPGPEDLKQRQRQRDTLSRLEAGLPEVTTTSRSGGSRRVVLPWLAAAAVIVLSAAIWLLVSPAGHSRLVRDSIVWVPRDAMTLGDNVGIDEALRAYDNADYELAYPGLARAVASGQLDSINLLYAGISAIGAGDPAAGRGMLSDLLDSGRYDDYSGEIRYNLALAEIELGAVRRGEELLRASVAAGYAPARDLLDKLSSVR